MSIFNEPSSMFDDGETSDSSDSSGAIAWGTAGLSGIAGIMGNNYEYEAGQKKADSLDWQASRYKYKAERADLMADAVKQQTMLNSSIMQHQFNQVQEDQIVKFAIQGRTGETVDNLISEDQEQLNWDQEFLEVSGRIDESNLRLDAAGYRVDDARSRVLAGEQHKSNRKQARVNLMKTAASVALLV